MPKRFDGDAVKRNGYRDQGILVISVDDPRLAWPEREMLRQIAEKLFGERATPAQP